MGVLKYAPHLAGSFILCLLLACGGDVSQDADVPDHPADAGADTALDDVGEGVEDVFDSPDSEHHDADESVDEDVKNIDEQDARGEEPDEDVLVVGDVGAPEDYDQRCDGKMADEWPFHAQISAGDVSAAEESDGYLLTIDASAGGFAGAAEEPFVYVDLDTQSRVEIDDFQAWEDTRWHLAFKRTIIRSNSEDSGPGNVLVGKQSGTTFEDAVLPDDDAPWHGDQTLDEDCEVILDPIGQPFTAFNYLNLDNPTGSASWYSYGSVGALAPVEGDIYFVRTQTGLFKLEIRDWVEGIFTIYYERIS